MTIQRAVADRVRLVRLPHWEPDAYIELPITPDGKVGMAATCSDITGKQTLSMLALLNDTESRYVPFERRKQKRFAHEIDGCNPASCPDCADERALRKP